jgi:hypothetical protein
VTAERIITINDVRAAGYCASGARRWFQSRGWDFGTFLSRGKPASELLATGDPMALNVVAKAEGRSDG